MSSVVRSVRASGELWGRWGAAADAAGLSLNGWMVRAATRVAELEEALACLEVRGRPVEACGPFHVGPDFSSLGRE